MLPMPTSTEPEQPPRLDPRRPLESLLEALDVSNADFARMLGVSLQAVRRAIVRGPGVSVRWLTETVRAAGFDLEIRITKRSRKKDQKSTREA